MTLYTSIGIMKVDDVDRSKVKTLPMEDMQHFLDRLCFFSVSAVNKHFTENLNLTLIPHIKFIRSSESCYFAFYVAESDDGHFDADAVDYEEYIFEFDSTHLGEGSFIIPGMSIDNLVATYTSEAIIRYINDFRENPRAGYSEIYKDALPEFLDDYVN